MGKQSKKCGALCLALFFAASSIFCAGEISDEARSLLSTAVMLTNDDLAANKGTIQILLQTCLDVSEGDALLEGVVNSVVTLLEDDNADPVSVAALLNSVLQDGSHDVVSHVDDLEEDSQLAEKTAVGLSSQNESEKKEQADLADIPRIAESGLPVFQVSSFIRTVLGNIVLVDVPGDWGNNRSDRAMTSYSPVNASGAISPAAGTLSISYFPMEQSEAGDALDSYVKNISDMSVVADVTTADTTAADLPARRLDFVMNVGANQFTCEAICFAYDRTVFTIELMQGQQAEYDFFNVYDRVVDSAEIGDEEDIRDVLESEGAQISAETSAADEAGDAETLPDVSEETVDEQPSSQDEENGLIDEGTEPAEIIRNEVSLQSEETKGEDGDAGSNGVNPDLPADMGTFMYELGGKVYQFPTDVLSLEQGALPLDMKVQLPYDFYSDEDMSGGTWTEIVNTQFYYFENSLYKEMAGVTNIHGYPVPMAEGILTALIDTQGSYVDITLPGGIKVGSREEDIAGGFPEFSGRVLDGLAGFRGNELLYACNIRDDGCHGYVLVRNDDPYYSAVSIICDGGIVKEISFECIGSARATGVFL